ncbi:MAG: aminoacyl-histidine dipeptidase [Clostridia bacterium]|nr:aminoacyl-histidine dipeptidase [Clostridia bacterium]
MNRVLSGLKPERVFAIFEDICAIPHGSGNTAAISEYCCAFAKRLGLWCHRDGLNNVIIKKPASVGFEDREPVVLQGHLDMVCEKEQGIDFDFLKSGLRLKTDGDYVCAAGTTLGGDDGIAVAMALAIAEDNSLKSPPLELVFTTDEETGMYGAAGLDASLVTAKRFINIDSENEGVFTVGCAGGCRVEIKLPLKAEKAEGTAYNVSVSGLTGGHSGTEINKGRLNANSVLAQFLKTLGGDIRVLGVSGGSKDNAIPTNAGCVVFCGGDINAAAKKFALENAVPADSGLKVDISPANADAAFSADGTKKVIDILNALPCGVQKMSEDIKGLVETSLNIGVVDSDECGISVTLSVRSSKSAGKAALINRLKEIADSFGAHFETRGDYPAWEYRKDSPLRDKMTAVFKSIYKKEPVIEVIHAGLECGLFAEKIEGIDAVSIGPDLFDIHTPRERLSISSVCRTYNYICRVLEEL